MPPLRQMFILDSGLYERHLKRVLEKQREFTEDTTRGMKRTGAAMQQTAQQGKGLEALFGRLKILAIGFVAAVATKFSLQNMIGLNAQLEQTRIRFTTLIGDAKEADEVLEGIFRFTERTPFQFNDVSEGARILLAYGQEVEGLQDTLRRLGDIAAGTGVALNDIARIYGKIRVNGIAQMQEVNQLQDKGIPIIEKLAAAYGKTALETRKMVENGKIGFEQVRQVIEELTNQGGIFAGGMDALSMSLLGMFSTLKDKLDALLRTLGAGLFEQVKADVDAFLATVNKLEESGQLDRWAKSVGEQVRIMYTRIRSATQWIVEHRAIIMRAITVYAALKAAQIAVALGTRAFTLALGAANAVAGIFKIAVITLYWAYAQLTRNTLLAANAQTALKVAFAATPWGAIATAIAFVATQLYIFTKRADESAEAHKKLTQDIEDATAAIESMSGAMIRQQQVKLGAEMATLSAEAQQLRNEAQLLDDEIAEREQRMQDLMKMEGGRTPAAMDQLAGLKEERERRMAVILEKQKALEDQMALNRAQQIAGVGVINGDLEKRIEYLQEINRQLSSGAEMTSQQQEQYQGNLRTIEQLEAILERRRKEAAGATKPAPEIDPQAVEKAKDLLETTTRQMERAAQLAKTNKELAATLKDIFDLTDAIQKLEEQAKAVGAESDTGRQLMARAAELGEQRSKLQDRIRDFEKFKAALDEALVAAVQLGNVDADVEIGIDIAELDPTAINAAIAAKAAELQAIADQTVVIKKEMDLDITTDERKEQLLQELMNLSLSAETQLGALILLMERMPGISTEARSAVLGLFEAFGLGADGADADVQEFSDRVRDILRPFEELTLKLAIETDEEKLPRIRSELDTLASTVRERLRKAFDELPEDVRNSAEAMRIFAAALQQVADQAATQPWQKFVDGARAAVQVLQELDSALSRIFGDTNDELREVIGNLSAVVDGYEQIQRGKAKIGEKVDRADGSVTNLFTAAGAFNQISGIIGIASGILALFRSSMQGGRSGEEVWRDAQKEMAEELRNTQDALREAARNITSSIESIFFEGRIGDDVSPEQVREARAGAEQLDRFLTDPVYGGGVGPIAEANAQIGLDRYLTELDQLDIGLDIDAYRQWIAAQRDLGRSWVEIANEILYGGEQLAIGIFDWVTAYEDSAGALGQTAQDLINRSRTYARFLATPDAAGRDDTFDKFIDEWLKMAGPLFEGMNPEEFATISNWRNLDLEDAEQRAQFMAEARDLYERAVAGGDTDLFEGLSPEAFIAFIEYAFTFGDAIAETTERAKTLNDALGAAGEASALVADLLGGSVAEAFRAWASTLAASEGTPQWLKDLLPQGINIDTAEGQQALQAFIEDTALKIRGGEYSEEQGRQLLAVLTTMQSFLNQVTGEQTSRSVSAIQGLTDFTGTKMLAGIEELVYFAKRGSDADLRVEAQLANIAALLGRDLNGERDFQTGGSIDGRSLVLNMPVEYHTGADEEAVIQAMTRRVEQKLRAAFKRPLQRRA